MDSTSIPPLASSWKNWGPSQPDNALSNELCASASYDMKAGTPATWQWQDIGCGTPLPLMCRMHKQQPQKIYSHSSGSRYLLNTHPMNFSMAQAFCNVNGGHLASYASAAEQAAVEQYYVTNGMLLPNFIGHSTYWMGLRTASWPRFSWLDATLPAPASTNFINWGSYMPGSIAEPNNLATSENCAVANFTQSTNPTAAWKWADAVCEDANIFMCEMVPPQLYRYDSVKYGATYFYDTAPLTQAAAESNCNDLGGHLVSWRNLAEQQEVEKYYVGSGYLIPTFHRTHWNGLVSTAWPKFAWAEKNVPAPDVRTYQHWGKVLNGLPEPNEPAARCGVGNFTQIYASASGWSDTRCNGTFTSLCRVQGEPRHPIHAAASAAMLPVHMPPASPRPWPPGPRPRRPERRPPLPALRPQRRSRPSSPAATTTPSCSTPRCSTSPRPPAPATCTAGTWQCSTTPWSRTRWSSSSPPPPTCCPPFTASTGWAS
jgi:hypothetical protein